MMFLVDTAEGRIIEDEEIKEELATSQPWEEWVSENLVELEDLPDRLHVQHLRVRPAAAADLRLHP